MASFSSTYPTQRPVFMADFANGGRIDPRATFTRASTANVWDGSKHLSSENLIANSEALTGTGYTSVNVTPTTGQADPTGGTNAVRFEQDSGQTTSGYVLVENQPSSGQFTYSFHAKANGKNYIVIQEVYTDSSLNETWFSISGAGGAGTTNANHTNVTVTKLGDWYRCSWTMTNTRVGYLRIGVADADNSTTVTDSGGVYLYGLQRNTGGSLLDYQSTSGQIHREYAPTLVSKANNVGRFDHTTDGQSVARGILIEGQSTNLRANSEQFNNWTQDGVLVDENSSIAPSGELTADTIRATGTGNHRIRQSVSIVSGSKFTGSFYAKANGYSHIQVGSANLATWAARAFFDLTNGTVGTITAGTAEIQSVGNGWYRCIVTGDGLATASVNIDVYPADGESASYVANEYGGTLLWGAMVEQSSHASSYIKTEAATATRAAESLSVDTADIGYTGGPVTGIVDAVNIGAANYPTFAAMADSTGSQRVTVQGDATSSNATTQVLTDGNLVAYITRPLTIAASKVGFRIDTDNYACVVNGGTVATDTSGAIPSSPSTLHIGQNHVSQYQLNGHIKRVAIFSEALSDANLISLTK